MQIDRLILRGFRNYEDAQALAERIRAIAEPKELIVCPHEPFTGAHVGPGMLGLFFFGSGRA